MAGVADPAHDPGVDRVEPDAAHGKGTLHPPQPAAEAADSFGAGLPTPPTA